MNTRARHAITGAALAALALLTGCGRDSASNGNGAVEPPPVPVSVQPVGRATVRRTLVLAGTVRPESRVQIYSKVAGRIEALNVEAGDEVKRGQELARLDSDLLAAGMKQAEAGAEVAAAELRAAEVALEDTRSDWKRARELFDNGAINEQARDKAKAALDAAGARRDLAASRLVQARAAVTAADVNLKEAKILSTIDGTVTRRYLDRGDFLSPGAPLVIVQDLRTVKITASITQADLPALTPGVTRAQLVAEGLEETFQTTVSRVDPVLDPGTLSAAIELRVENRRRPPSPGAVAGPWQLVSGMSVRVALDIEELRDSPVVPLTAVRNDGIRDFVFALAEDGKSVKRVDVKLGRLGTSPDEMSRLVQLLEPADLVGRRIVIQGVTRVTDGAKVRVTDGHAQPGPDGSDPRPADERN